MSESFETASTLPLFIDLQTRYLQKTEWRAKRPAEGNSHVSHAVLQGILCLLQRQMKNIYGEISCKTSVSDQDIYRMETNTVV